MIEQHTATTAKGKKSDGWRSPERAKRATGGGILVPQGHAFDADGNLLGDRPSLFSAEGRRQLRDTGRNAYDTNVRGFSGGAFTGQAIMRFALSLGDREETVRPYEENFVVRSGLRAFANGMVSLPFQLWDGPPSDDASEPLESHPLLDLLARPNRLQTGEELTFAHTVGYKHDGEVFYFLMDANGDPVDVNDANGLVTSFPAQILSVRGEKVEHKTDKSGFPTEYRYGIGGGGWSPSFPWQSVIQFAEYDPYNPLRGLGDIRSLMREIDLMFQSYRYLDASVKNGGDPGGFITFDESVGQDELDRRQANADDMYTVENAGRFKVMDRKAKFTPNPTKPKDMEYLGLFDWCLKAICAGIGTPPPIIGWYDDATYNNLDGARREMWAGANGILSHSAGRQDTFKNKLMARLEGTNEMRGQSADLYPFYNPSRIEVLKKDRSEQLLNAAKVAASGVGVSYNEALSQAELDVDPAAEGDQAYVDNRLREAGEPSTVAASMSSAKPAPSATKSGDADETRDLGDYEWRAMPTRAEAKDADPTVTKRAKKWLGDYEKKIIARLGVYANGGRKPNARGTAVAPEVRINLGKLTDKDVAFLVLNEAQWIKALDKLMSAPIKALWKDGLNAAQKVVGGSILNVTDPKILSQVADQLVQLTEGVTSATSAKVKSAIIKTLAEVGGEMTMQQAIKEALPELTKELRRVFASKAHRALTISITETNKATQGANFTQMGEAQVTKKRWATRSSNPRPSHVAQQAAGEIDFDATFPNGGKHPHDPSLPASEVVNCVCDLEALAFKGDA